MKTMSDTDRFIDHVRPLFGPDEVLLSRAPGRIDLMGGIADYSGSLVLQWPIAAATHVALQLQQTAMIQIRSLSPGAEYEDRFFEMPLAHLSAVTDYSSARALFETNSVQHWAAYVAGAFFVLLRERRCVFEQGAQIVIASNVPEGKGVSSSAALEVAAMTAIAAAYHIEISPEETAFLSQKVENLVAGAPCGVMDQMTAACGQRNRLLSLLCQPGELQGTISLPAELTIWGLDSGVRHSITAAAYGVVRTAAFMGQRIISELGDLPKDVYLANITPAQFAEEFAMILPERMSGEDFLCRYDGLSDSVTSVNSDSTYPVLAATKHPIYEHARVKLFADVLQNWTDPRQGNTLGKLMYESHESYSACGLGSSGTDELVRLVQEVGPDGGLYGAKITGGGSGGTVAVLGERSAAPVIDEIAKRYADRIGYQPLVITGSSDGAARFGTLRI